VRDAAAHMEHIRDVAGVAHLGIGSDYYDPGGPSMVEGLENVSRFPVLFAELLRRGWSEEDLKAVAAGNLLRAFREVERNAARLRETGPPSTADLTGGRSR